MLEGDYKFKDLFKFNTYKRIFDELMEMDLDDAFLFLILTVLFLLMGILVLGLIGGLISLLF